MIHMHRAEEVRTRKVEGTKTKHARRISIEPTLLPLLSSMHEECGGDGLVIDVPRDLARPFREFLKRAGVERAELHEDTPTRKAMTFYDLRATGITWSAVRGDEPLKIMQRAGHTEFDTTMIYVRMAEELRRGFGTPFAPLPAELVGHPSGVFSIRKSISDATSPRNPAETHRNRTCPGQPNCPTSVLKTEGGTSRPRASAAECSGKDWGWKAGADARRTATRLLRRRGRATRRGALNAPARAGPGEDRCRRR
jgi:hypothetical protein